MRVLRIIFVFIISVLCLLSMCSCLDTNLGVYIFEDIKECQNIIANKSDDAEIELYDTPNSDKYLNNLQYNDFFACKYLCDDFEFEIFAYEFVDSDTNKQYFENAADRTSERYSDFLSWGGISNYSSVVIDGNNAYIIHSSTSNKKKVTEFIATVFSLKLF